MQQTLWLMTDTDHAENERLVNVALVALSPSLNCMFPILLRKPLQLCSEYPTLLILIQPAAGGGERDQLSCHLQLIWFSPQSSRHKTLRLKSVFIYIKKSTYVLNFELFTPFLAKKKKKSLQLFFLWIYSLQCYCQGTKGNREKYKLRMKLKEKKRKKQQ